MKSPRMGMDQVFVVWLVIAVAMLLLLAPQVWTRDKVDIPPPSGEKQPASAWLQGPRLWTKLTSDLPALARQHRLFRSWYWKSVGRPARVGPLKASDVRALWRLLAPSLASGRRPHSATVLSLPLGFEQFKRLQTRDERVSTAGLVWLLRRFLEALGCPSREVLSDSRDRWGAGEPLRAVEIWLSSQKKWAALFVRGGVMVRRRGKWLSARELAATRADDPELRWSRGNSTGKDVVSVAGKRALRSRLTLGEIRWMPLSGRAAGTLRVLKRWPARLVSLVSSRGGSGVVPFVTLPRGAKRVREWSLARWSEQGWHSVSVRPRPLFPPLRRNLGPDVQRWLRARKKGSILVTTWAGMKLQGPTLELGPGAYVFALKARVWRGRLQVTLRLGGRETKLHGLSQAHHFQGRNLRWLRWRIRLSRRGRVQLGLRPRFGVGVKASYGFWELSRAQLWRMPRSSSPPSTVPALLAQLPAKKQDASQGSPALLSDRRIQRKAVSRTQAGWRFSNASSSIQLRARRGDSALLCRLSLSPTSAEVGLVSWGENALSLKPGQRVCLGTSCLQLKGHPQRPRWLLFQSHGSFLSLSTGNQQLRWRVARPGRTWRLGSQKGRPSFQGVLHRLSLFKGGLSSREAGWLMTGENASKLRVSRRHPALPIWKRWEVETLRSFHSSLFPIPAVRSFPQDVTLAGVKREGGGSKARLEFGARSQLRTRFLEFQEDQTLLFKVKVKGDGTLLRLAQEVGSSSRPTSRSARTGEVLFVRGRSLCLGTQCRVLSAGWSWIAVVWRATNKSVTVWLGGERVGSLVLAKTPSHWELGRAGSEAAGARFSMRAMLRFQKALTPAAQRLYQNSETTPLRALRSERWFSNNASLLFAQNFSSLMSRYRDVASNGVSLVPGRSGEALRLDGKGFWAWKQSPSSQKMTLSFWVKPAVLRGTIVASQEYPPGTSWRWKVSLSQGKPCFALYAGKSFEICARSSLVLGKWSLVTISLDTPAGRMSLWLDGAKAAQGPAQRFQPMGVLTVGLPRGKGAFRGVLDDLRLWSRAFSPKQLWRLNLLPPERGRRQQWGRPPRLSLRCDHSPAKTQRRHKRLNFRGLEWRVGRRGGGCAFEGKDAGVSTQFGSGVTREISLWFLANGQRSGGLGEMRSEKHGSWLWQWFRRTDGRVCLVVYVGSSVERCSRPIPSGQWVKTSIRLDWTTKRASLQVNGENVGSTKLKAPLAGGRLVLGRSSGQGPFQGTLDDVTLRQ